MREILFRAKRIDNGEWIEGDLVHAPDGRTAASTYDDLVETDPETVCQWTGLADKDGRKIFEGDICKIHSGPIDEEDGCFSVEWDEGDARFALYGEGLTVDFGNYHGHECEVIGNIFDNPDLLPEEDT
ncbi:hypothetical protein E5357_06190 [Hominisplanchenecus murintestinalis]|uniref:Uncharacterized protein n=1 Tax=Hominisplanchenecus murintestinalis TaxID=2941517 RepID=A0AC61R101_9FIRM|nr:YopX family protein [Hominisplanchenecus murintestinalis]TGX99196.1 hypothetical protein E5357_06190 [Hominisplanchenecus murintestinalis]